MSSLSNLEVLRRRNVCSNEQWCYNVLSGLPMFRSVISRWRGCSRFRFSVKRNKFQIISSAQTLLQLKKDMEVGGGRKVVIIGGGVAGSIIARSLQFTADVTLIDAKEYFEIPWASLRGMVEPSFAQRSVINHKDYLSNARISASRAVNITSSDVLTAEGRLFPYDYLVIATGHDDPLPKTRKERLEEYQSENEKIRAARSVMVVGGGPTGVELAAEIAVDFPEKKVTLVHDGSRLLEFMGPKSSLKTLEWLRGRDVEVKLQQSVGSDSHGKIKADCIFSCTGKAIGSAWLKNTILKDSIDQLGRLKVDEYMRIKGLKKIFAIGDITDIKEAKQGYLAQKHALVAAKNIKILLNGEKEGKMEIYKPRSVKIIVSLGRHDAVAQYSFTTLIGLIPGMIKSKDLFVGKTRKKMGLHPLIPEN